MDFINLFRMCALLSIIVHASPDITSTSLPPVPDAKSNCDTRKSKILNKWEKFVDSLKDQVNSAIRRLTSRSSCFPASRMDNYVYEVDSTNKNTDVQINLFEAGPSSAVSKMSYHESEARSSNTKSNPNCRSRIARIPDALSPEEMKILKDLERQNERIRKAKEEMNSEWSRAGPTQRPRTNPGLLIPHWRPQINQNLDEKGQLTQRKVHLLVELDYLECMTTRYRNHVIPYLRARPRGRLQNDILTAPRQMYEEMHGGHYDNLCNRMTEARREIHSIVQRIENINSGPQELTCQRINHFRSEK